MPLSRTGMMSADDRESRATIPPARLSFHFFARTIAGRVSTRQRIMRIMSRSGLSFSPSACNFSFSPFQPMSPIRSHVMHEFTSFATCVVAPRFASLSSILIEPPGRSYMCDASSPQAIMAFLTSGPDQSQGLTLVRCFDMVFPKPTIRSVAS